MSFNDVLQRRSSIVILWYTTIFFSLLAVLCIVSVMIKDVGANIAFTWHPILMTISFLICMTQGIHSYLIGFGGDDDGGDGGDGNGNGNGNGNNRTNKSRTYHGILMMVALLTAIGGYVAIYIAHSNGKGHTAVGDPYIKQFHTWFGYIILVGIVFQSLIGITKYTLLKTQNRNFAKFHGLMGPMLWIWGCINIFLGVWFWSSESYNLFLQIIISISILIIVLITILFFNILLRNSSSSPISASNVDHNVVSSLSTVEVNQTTEVM
jgi:hypothetical protein